MENKGANRNWKAKEVRHDRLFLHSYVLYFCNKVGENSRISKKDVFTYRYISFFFFFLFENMFFQYSYFLHSHFKKKSPKIRETK